MDFQQKDDLVKADKSGYGVCDDKSNNSSCNMGISTMCQTLIFLD